MARVDEFQVRQVAIRLELVKFAFPLRPPGAIREVVVITTEIDVRHGPQRFFGRKGNLRAGSEGIREQRNLEGTDGRTIVSKIDEEAVVAEAFARAQGGIPQISRTCFPVGAVRCGNVRGSGEEIRVGWGGR